MPNSFFPELMRFFIQIGIAVGGATSLWAAVFLFKYKRSGKEVYCKFAELLTWLFSFSFIFFLAFWWISANFIFIPDALAHEGIAIRPTINFIKAGFDANFPLVIILMVVSLANIHFYFNYRKFWNKSGAAFFAIQFILFSAIAILGIFSGTLFSERQLFFSFHSWHSILTLGGVIVVDYLFLATLRLHDHKKFLYEFFPTISLFIWLGLGVDFLSNWLIFEEAFKITPQFLFIQTIVGIIIINGAFLSGRINEILIHFAKLEKKEMVNPLLKRIIGVSGSISIVSWLTITFVDFFEFNLRYTQFFGIYLLFIVLAYLVHNILEAQLLKHE